MSYSWLAGGDWGGGLCMVICIDPNDPTHLFVGGDTWGLRETFNSGLQWFGANQGLNANLDSVNVCYGRSCAISKKHAGRVYVGTGRINSSAGLGHLLKVDNGVTTVLSSSYAFGSNVTVTSEPRARVRMHVEYSGSGVESVFMAGHDGFARMDDEAAPIVLMASTANEKVDGYSSLCYVSSTVAFVGSNRHAAAGGAVVHKVTANGGKTLLTAAGPSDVTVTTLGSAPAVVNEIQLLGGTIFACCGQSGAYTVSADGATWTHLSGLNAGTSEVSCIDGDGTILMVGCATLDDLNHGAFVSTNGGTTWTSVSPSTALTTSNVLGINKPWWHVQGLGPGSGWLGTKSEDINSITMGADNQTFYIAGRTGVYKTTNRGTAWNPAVYGLNGITGNGIQKPVSGSNVTWAVADWDGFSSTDNGLTATQLNSVPATTPNLNTITVGSDTYAFVNSHPCDVTKNGASITNSLFQKLCVNAKDWAVSPDGHIYIMQWGGLIVGSPGGGGGGAGGGTDFGPGGNGGGPWSQLYEQRKALGGAAQTNYGAGQHGRSLYHYTATTAGNYPALQGTTWGYGKYAALSIALVAGAGDTTPPTVPTGLTATPSSQTQINLSWTASTDANGVAGYTIYRNGSSVGTSLGPSFADTGLTAATQYTYTVDAFDAAGNHSSQSTQVQATTLSSVDTQPPTTPGGFTATVTGSSVTLTWTASTDNVAVAGYTVTRNGTVIAPSITQTSYVDQSGVAGTSYTYTVDAFDAAGNRSAESASQTVTYPQPVTGPQVHGSIIVDATAATSITAAAPAGTQPGDLIFAQIRIDVVLSSAQDFVAPAGWIISGGGPVKTITTADFQLRSYTSGGGPWMWTWPTAANANIILIAISPATIVSGLSAAGNPQLGDSPNPGGSVTLADSGDLVLFLGAAIGSFTAGSRPPGTTLLQHFGAIRAGTLSPFADYAVGQPNGTQTYNSTFQCSNGWTLSIQPFKTKAIVQNQGPVLSITSPVGGQTITGSSVNVQATATDSDGVSGVTVAVNGGSPQALSPVSVDAGGSGSYAGTVTVDTDVAPGASNTLVIVATDSNVTPASTQQSVTINAVTPASDTSPPTIVWGDPANGTNASVEGTDPWPYTISFSASDPSGLGPFTIDAPVASGISVTPDANGNFSLSLTLAIGANAFTVHSTDAVGNTASTAFTITLTTPAAPDVTGPSVSMISPIGNVTIPGADGIVYTVAGTADDPSAVASVTVNGASAPLGGDSGDEFSVGVSLALGANTITTVATDAAPAQSAIQTITTTGSPTGGTFTLTFGAQTTTALQYNDSAANIQAALRALSSIGAGNITCTGGPLPTGVVATFTGALAHLAEATITHTDSLTGGSSPHVAVAVTQIGNPGANQTTITSTVTVVSTLGPTLTITNPAASAVTIIGDAPFLFELQGTVTATGTNGLSQLLVNQIPIVSASDGSWSEVVALSEGINQITITAVDAQPVPQSTTTTVTITLEPSAGTSTAFDLSSDQARMAERLQERGLQ